MTQSHFAGVKTSITENQDQWAEHMKKWIAEEYQTAARCRARARQIPTGRSAKHLESTRKQRLKQCNKAADSWPTTAWKRRLGATQAGGGQVSKQLHKHPRGLHSASKHQALLQAKQDCWGSGQGQTAPAHKDHGCKKATARQHAQDPGTSEDEACHHRGDVGSVPWLDKSHLTGLPLVPSQGKSVRFYISESDLEL